MKITKSAGGVVVNPKGQVLIVDQNGNSWSLPKGHVDPGETALEAAIREIREESGVSELVLVKELGAYQRPKIGLHLQDDPTEIKSITLFLFKTTQMLLKPTDPHNPQAKWIEPAEVNRWLTHPKDREFFESIAQEIALL